MKKPAKEIHKIDLIMSNLDNKFKTNIYTADFNKVKNFIDYQTTQLAKK